MKSKDTQLLEEAYANVQQYVSESVSDEEIKQCESIIKKLAKGEFENESADVMDRVKHCAGIFSVTKDKDGHYTVIIKDSALSRIEQMYPALSGKFKSAADCKKDVAKCRQDKMK